MIAVDVGLNIPISWRLVLYQSILAFVYLCTQLLGASVGSLVFFLYSSLMTCFPFLGPLYLELDLRHYRERCKPTVHMTYPYYYTYRNILTGNMKKMLSRFPSCPLLYMVRSSQANIYYLDYCILRRVLAIFMFVHRCVSISTESRSASCSTVLVFSPRSKTAPSALACPSPRPATGSCTPLLKKWLTPSRSF